MYRRKQLTMDSSPQNDDPNSRQLPIMLYLVFKFGQVLDDSFSLFALLLVGHVAHGTVKVINGTGLSQNDTISILIYRESNNHPHSRESQAIAHGQKRSQSSICRRCDTALMVVWRG